MLGCVYSNSEPAFSAPPTMMSGVETELKTERLRWFFEEITELPTGAFDEETKLATIKIVRRSMPIHSRDARLISMGVYAVLENDTSHGSIDSVSEFFSLEIPIDFRQSTVTRIRYDISSLSKIKAGKSYYIALKSRAGKHISYFSVEKGL